MLPRWFPMTLVIAAMYLGVAIGAAPHTRWTSPHHVEWRLFSWLVSAIAFAIQIAYEVWRLRSSPLPTALHCATAAALGAFGLAVDIALTTAQGPRFIFALVAFPLFVGVPAFVVALAVAALLTRFRTSAGPPPATAEPPSPDRSPDT